MNLAPPVLEPFAAAGQAALPGRSDAADRFGDATPRADDRAMAIPKLNANGFFPLHNGVLFRQEEADMRRKLIEADLIECVLGLGPNLFYNSPMEACVVICRTAKPKARKGKILLINAVNEVTRERAQSFLTDDHIERILKAYQRFKDEPGFTRVATVEEIRAKEGNLSIPLYVAPNSANRASDTDNLSPGNANLTVALADWLRSSNVLATSMNAILNKQTGEST